jgi:hypothetical protein
VNAVGMRPWRKVWMLWFLLLLRSCLSSRVAVLSRRLFLYVRSWCQRLRSLRLSKIFCFISKGHSLVLSGLVCSGVVFQQAHWIVSLKYWTDASMSSAVLKGICRASRSVLRFLNSSTLVRRLHRLGGGSRRRACDESVTKIGE